MLKTTSILLALGIVFAIVGCSGGDSSATSGSASDVSTTAASGDSSSSSEPATSISAPSEPAATTASFVTDAKPVIDAKCLGCHSGAGAKGGLDLTTIATNDDAKEKAEWVKKMAGEVSAGKMPPAKGAPLTEEEKTKLLAGLNSVGS